jgi:hypothetical protein
MPGTGTGRLQHRHRSIVKQGTDKLPHRHRSIVVWSIVVWTGIGSIVMPGTGTEIGTGIGIGKLPHAHRHLSRE